MRVGQLGKPLRCHVRRRSRREPSCRRQNFTLIKLALPERILNSRVVGLRVLFIPTALSRKETLKMLNSKLKKFPVRIFQKGNKFGLVAPLAGLEPEDITVSVEGKRVTIRGKERGPGQ